jgi:uncharacterized membrane protein YraQ (UPF0718 family)
MIEHLLKLLYSFLSKGYYYIAGTYTQKVVLAAWDLFAQLWCFLLVAILLTSLTSLFWRRSAIVSFLERSPRLSIVTAALVGIVSPMPTYVTIPLIATLFTVGVPAAPLFAFLVASPLMNPILFSLTAGAFGYEMAVARTLSALILGIAAGLIVRYLVPKVRLNDLLCNGGTPAVSMHTEDSGARTLKFYATQFPNSLFRVTKFVSKYFFIGIAVAAAVKVLIPADWIISTLGSHRSISVLAAVAAGVPLYACGGGTIPVMQTLQEMGMDKGAILAFFISGPATKLSTLAALRAAVRKEAFFLYLTIGFLGASLFGFGYSLW